MSEITTGRLFCANCGTRMQTVSMPANTTRAYVPANSPSGALPAPIEGPVLARVAMPCRHETPAWRELLAALEELHRDAWRFHARIRVERAYAAVREEEQRG